MNVPKSAWLANELSSNGTRVDTLKHCGPCNASTAIASHEARSAGSRWTVTQSVSALVTAGVEVEHTPWWHDEAKP